MAESLEPCVEALRHELAERDLGAPDALAFLATGSAFLAEELEACVEVSLAECAATPRAWRSAVLRSGRFGRLALWAIDDCGHDLEPGGAPWLPGLPVWLAAATGARICLHASAGVDLGGAGDSPAPRFLVATDHLNLSGSSPLLGLGETRLGPLFPDLAALHDEELRRAARARAETLGMAIDEGVVACLAGPALATPAERRMHAQLGARASVQGLAAPLIAAGHAGLRVLALVCLLESEAHGEPADGAHVDIARLTARALGLEPELQQLILALLPDLESAVHDTRTPPHP